MIGKHNLGRQYPEQNIVKNADAKSWPVKIITAGELQDHIDTLRAKMMEELKKEEDAKTKEGTSNDREA